MKSPPLNIELLVQVGFRVMVAYYFESFPEFSVFGYFGAHA